MGNPLQKANARASLLVVGTGIQWRGQTTLAAQHAIESADSVLYAVTDRWAAAWIRSLNHNARSFEYPRDRRPRAEIYQAMAAAVLAELERGCRTTAVFYGSPRFMALPAELAVKKARAHGFPARVLPGVSSIECLFADLDIDPARGGYRVYEATDYLTRKPAPDVQSHLVLCQIALVDHHNAGDGDGARIQRGLTKLRDFLLASYPVSHVVTVYTASSHPIIAPKCLQAPLGQLASCPVDELASLYVPPLLMSAKSQSSVREVGPLADARGL